MSTSQTLASPTTRAYLEDTVRSWIGLPGSGLEKVPPLPEDLGRLLLRSEEYEQAHRDQWGNWEFSFSDNFRRGQLWKPEVDMWVAERRAELASSVPLEPLWPDDHRFAVCLTHDVDLVSSGVTPRQALRFLGTAMPDGKAQPRDWLEGVARAGVRALRTAAGGISRSPTATALERCTAIEQEHGVNASYFFTVYPGREASRFDCVYAPDDVCGFRGRRTTVAGLIQELAREGFDIGLHGSYRSSAESGVLERERDALGRATGLEVTTTRQHFLRWDVRRTPRLQAQAGICADTTLGFNRNLGFRAGTALPHRHFDPERGEAVDVLLVPLVVHDTPLLRADGLELDLGLATESVRTILDEIVATGGVATFLIHPNNLEVPKLEALFRWLLEYGREHGAWFASLREIDRWWRAREARLHAE